MPEERPGGGGELRPDGRGDGAAEGAAEGIRLFGVIRKRRGAVVERRQKIEGIEEVGYRDLAAVVRREPYVLPEPTRENLEEHHRMVDLVLQETSVLPAPFGVYFRDEEGLRRFLEMRYPTLDAALALTEAHWELRVTVRREGGEVPEEEVWDAAGSLYEELLPLARMGVRGRPVEDGVVAVAFLVPRDQWIHFVEEAESRAEGFDGVATEVSGPWPPYDFVRIRPPGA